MKYRGNFNINKIGNVKVHHKALYKFPFMKQLNHNKRNKIQFYAVKS